MISGSGRAWVDIDLGALQRNALAIAARAGVPILPMVKADAYGLGAVAVVRALEALEPWGYGVATVEEGAELREAGITRRIIVFTPLGDDDLRAASHLSLTPALSSAPAIRAWASFAATARTSTHGRHAWHLAIDTGMSRAGIRWDAVQSIDDAIRACPPEGAFTHFHSAERGDGSLERQEARFRDALATLPRARASSTQKTGPRSSAAVVRRGTSRGPASSSTAWAAATRSRPSRSFTCAPGSWTSGRCAMEKR